MTKISFKKIFFLFMVCLLINTQQASACLTLTSSTAQEAFKSNDVVFSGVNKGCRGSGDEKYILYEVDKIWKGKKYNNVKYPVEICPSEIEDDFIRKHVESNLGQKFIVYSKYKDPENPTNSLYNSPRYRCHSNHNYTELTYKHFLDALKSLFDGRRSAAKKELQFLGEPIYQIER